MELSSNNLWKYISVLVVLLIVILDEFLVYGVRGGPTGRSHSRSVRHYGYSHHSSTSPGSASTIIGIVVGCIFGFLLVVGGLILCCMCYKKPRPTQGHVVSNGDVSRNTTDIYPPPYTEIATPMTVYNTAFDNTMEKTDIPPGSYPPTNPYNQSGEFVPPPPYETTAKY